MNLYEHTIITKQDVSPSQLKQLIEKYSKIVEKLEGDLVKTENWGLLNLSYIINKNKIKPILEAIIHDKKNINNKIKMSLLEKIGKCGYNYNVNELVINESINYYNTCI